MNSFGMWENQMMKVIENERKCLEFVRFLNRNNLTQYDDDRYVSIDEHALQTISIVVLVDLSSQLKQKNNNQSQSLQPKDGSIDLKEQHTVHHPDDMIEEQNQFIKPISADSHFSSLFDQQVKSTKQKQFTKVFEEVTMIKNNSIQEKQQHDSQNEQNEEYFQLKIINKNRSHGEAEDIFNDVHQVQIFNSGIRSKTPEQNFNLSNFSSFNGKSIPMVNNPLQSSFYEKEFVYLVKKIQLVHGKKLSEKGIQNIVNQLQLFVSKFNSKESVNNNIKDVKNQRKIKQIFKLKDYLQNNPDKTILKEKNNYDSNIQKKIIFQSKNQTNLKTKNKAKYNLSNNYLSKEHLNKENSKSIHEVNKFKSKKQHERSVSPLSYRVMMEKKKQQDDKTKQNPKNQSILFSQALKKPVSNKSYQTSSEQNSLSTRFQPQIKRKQKTNKLKIILQQNLNNQHRTKTLCFEYLQFDKNIQKQIESYCMMNKIGSSKNIKLIHEALNKQKPIITIKQQV